ncbi:MAG: CdaR family protein [Acidobacteriota bacterium]
MIRRLDTSDMTAFIDLSDWTLGEKTYSISQANLRVPLGVNITQISPNKLQLRFEETQRKSVEIRPRLIGKLAKGYEKRVLCTPAATEIEGPAAHLRGIQFVTTDSIDISGRTDGLTRRVSLYVDDPLVRLSTEEAVVEIDVFSSSESKPESINTSR